jgi:hypothetical protein
MLVMWQATWRRGLQAFVQVFIRRHVVLDVHLLIKEIHFSLEKCVLLQGCLRVGLSCIQVNMVIMLFTLWQKGS